MPVFLIGEQGRKRDGDGSHSNRALTFPGAPTTASHNWQTPKYDCFKVHLQKLENNSSCGWKTDALLHLLQDTFLSTPNPAENSKITSKNVFYFGPAEK